MTDARQAYGAGVGARNPTQQATEQVGSRDDAAVFLAPHENQVAVAHIVTGPFLLNGEPC